MNRRQFISSVVASGAAPMLFNGCVGGFLANKKINVAVVGYAVSRTRWTCRAFSSSPTAAS